MSRRRSGCPINLTLEMFGDRWSLIILRDTMFGGVRPSARPAKSITTGWPARRFSPQPQ